jgi:tetratricopeptide (TPR) repeat protein
MGLFGKSKKKRLEAEIKIKEKENLDQYLTFFPKEKMKYKYEPLCLDLAGAKHYMHYDNTFLFKEGEQVLLWPESDNEYDKNAVKVVTLRGHKIGYISKYYAKDIGNDLDNGYYYKAIISSIYYDENGYPEVMLDLIKYSDVEEVKVSDEELEEFARKLKLKEREYEENSAKAYKLSKKGRNYEADDMIEEAVKFYEKAIEFTESPPLAFERLAIYYRKNKDFDNEIRVIQSWIKACEENSGNPEIVEYQTSKVKARLEKAFSLRNKHK